MQKIILLSAIVALASGASAAYWKQCEPLNTKINSLQVKGCNPQQSTPDRCAITAQEHHEFEINFKEPKPFKAPIYRMDYGEDDGFHYESGACGLFLECPGQTGQEQHLNHMIYYNMFTETPSNFTMRLSLRENGTSVDKPDLLCADLSLLVIEDRTKVPARSLPN